MTFSIEQTIFVIAILFSFFVVKMIAGGSLKAGLSAVLVLGVVFVGGMVATGTISIF